VARGRLQPESSASDSEHMSHTAHGHAPLDPGLRRGDAEEEFITCMMTVDEISDFLASNPNTIITGDFCVAPPPLTPPSRGGGIPSAGAGLSSRR
jgi:hypothetical protein